VGFGDLLTLSNIVSAHFQAHSPLIRDLPYLLTAELMNLNLLCLANQYVNFLKYLSKGSVKDAFEEHDDGYYGDEISFTRYLKHRFITPLKEFIEVILPLHPSKILCSIGFSVRS
jgi:hypothetical protein